MTPPSNPPHSDAPIRIGTRGSRLALWQAEHAAARLRGLPEAPDVEIVRIRTEGDRVQDVPLHAVPGKAFFTKEIEEALLASRVDVAVHSLKDLATVQPDGLVVGAVPVREDPRDAWLHREGATLAECPPAARVGTSSLRRKALLARLRPDVAIEELRGNVPTRIEKLRAGEYDAVVLAAAGLRRLGLADAITETLDPQRFPPAVSQGALAFQCRSSDRRTRGLLARLDDAGARAETDAERALLRRLEGGCQVPVGALARIDGYRLRLRATVASLDGAAVVSGEIEGPAGEAEALGLSLAEDLLARGAGGILLGIRGTPVR